MEKIKVEKNFEIILVEGYFSEVIKRILAEHSVSQLWIEDNEMSVAQLNASVEKIGGAVSVMRLFR